MEGKRFQALDKTNSTFHLNADPFASDLCPLAHSPTCDEYDSCDALAV